jgi:lipopolysaccharide export system protein LptA
MIAATRRGRMMQGLAALGSFAMTAGLFAANGLMPAARAQALINHNSNAPVDFAADSIEVQSRADRVVVSGNVVVQQAGLTLTAARLTVAYSDTGGVDVNRLDALGGVTVTKGGDRARGDSAIYDLDRRLITMLGNVELTQGANRLSGNRLVIDLASGRASVDGRAGASAPAVPGTVTGSQGRVTGRFTVPERN